MERIGISKEKDEFVPRKSFEESFREEVAKKNDNRMDASQEEGAELDMDFQNALQGMANLMGKAQRAQRENGELRKQNALLLETVKKLENDELAQVVNLETVLKYAFRQKNPQVVRTIANMLVWLCFDRGCNLEAVRVKVRELEDYAASLEAPQPVSQNNQGCQQFYGLVTESEFHS